MGGDVKNLVRVAVGLGTMGLSEVAYYQPAEQRKAIKQASDVQQRAEMEARRIAAQKTPMEESATLKMNTQAGSVDPLSSLNLIVDPQQRRKNVGLNTNLVNTGLGFGS